MLITKYTWLMIGWLLLVVAIRHGFFAVSRYYLRLRDASSTNSSDDQRTRLFAMAKLAGNSGHYLTMLLALLGMLFGAYVSFWAEDGVGVIDPYLAYALACILSFLAVNWFRSNRR